MSTHILHQGMYFEDFEVGQQFSTNTARATKDEIILFAKEWDQQYFHLDEEAAKKSTFGMLVGSGLHVLMLSWKLFDRTGILRNTAVAGVGFDDLRFKAPFLPDEDIHVELSVLEKSLTSKSDRGKLRIKFNTYDSSHQNIFTFTLIVLVACRPC